MLSFLGLVFYFILLVITASMTYSIYHRLRLKRTFSKGIILQIIGFWLILIIFALTDLNKLHIIWIIPLVYFVVVVVSNLLFAGLPIKYSIIGMWEYFLVVIGKNKKGAKELEDLEKYLQSDKK